ncbi:glycosyltransferase [Jatrophihabitans sp. YIM 134969]
MTGIRAVAVVVPAHDEQDLIGRCLDALALAREALARVAPHVVTTVTVVLDACGDDTAGRVAVHPGVDSVTVAHHCVGAARAAGTVAAVAALDLPLDTIWTAHTDADSVVGPGWLTAMLEAADAGVDAVLGTVVPDAALAAPVRAAWSALHLVVEGHPHVHGANLGVRASTWAAVGGWRPLATGEDVDLAERLRVQPGAVVLSTGVEPVVTSSRAAGRAPAGFSSYLRELNVV